MSVNTTSNATENNDAPDITFDEILADTLFQSEFDKRVAKALTTNSTKLNEEFKLQLAARDTDLATLKSQLEKVGADTEALAILQKTYTEDKQALETRLIEQSREFALKQSLNDIKFSSKGARQAFADACAKQQLQLDKDNGLLGFNDFLNSYKQDDPEAFVAEVAPPIEEQSTAPDPVFVKPMTGGTAMDANPFKFNFTSVRGAPEK